MSKVEPYKKFEYIRINCTYPGCKNVREYVKVKEGLAEKCLCFDHKMLRMKENAKRSYKKHFKLK